MRPLFLDPREFVAFWFKDYKKYTMKANGLFDGNSTIMFDMLWLDYLELFAAEYIKHPQFDATTGKKKRAYKVSEGDMQKALNEFLTEEQERAREAAVELIKHDGYKNNQLSFWLKSVTGTCTDFQLAVMRHLLWQVKRKAFNLRVVYHLCPIFFGKQSGGKSSAIATLFKPLEDFMLDFNPAQVVDERNFSNLSSNLVCIFDEMAGIARVEMEALKRIITADWVTYRPLYSNKFMKVKQNTTFVGISNKSLTENIYDSTGLRRFVEFACLDVLDWDLLKSVDAMSLWKSIDENLEEGYIIPVIEQLREHQKEMTIQDEIQQYLTEQRILPEGDEGVREVTSKELWNDYVAWRGTSGYGSKQVLAINSFCMKLRTHKLVRKVKRVEGKESTLYLVSDKASMLYLEKDVDKKILTFRKG